MENKKVAEIFKREPSVGDQTKIIPIARKIQEKKKREEREIYSGILSRITHLLKVSLILLLIVPSSVSAINPNALSYYKQGNIYYDVHQYDMAIWAFDIAITLDTNFAEVYTNRGIVYNDRGKQRESSRRFRVWVSEGR